MVSGLTTSPLDQERICFEEASPIEILSKLLMSIIYCSRRSRSSLCLGRRQIYRSVRPRPWPRPSPRTRRRRRRRWHGPLRGRCPTPPVSYTHLRAHETDSYLVCRLLL